ncbi:unnamed protein product [Rodentolepis nana]|uniref:Vacuolar protein sorting-associated protein 28 homolog n=1 Tax=Rodentolepis nana TaxID=102285 RepID=A0A0R3TN22_RODNA|nr:unnamed protein product [Rodentolepis nana]
MANLLEEVQLWKTSAEREKVRNLAEVYALINSLQFLQKAFIKDCIKEDKYASLCRRLLSQLKEAFVLVKNEYPSYEACIYLHCLNCVSLRVFPFINCIQIQPDIDSLWKAMNGLSILPPNFDGKEKMRHWLDVMEPMGASDSLTTEQGRQLQFDVETAYGQFKSIIQ